MQRIPYALDDGVSGQSQLSKSDIQKVFILKKRRLATF